MDYIKKISRLEQATIIFIFTALLYAYSYIYNSSYFNCFGIKISELDYSYEQIIASGIKLILFAISMFVSFDVGRRSYKFENRNFFIFGVLLPFFIGIFYFKDTDMMMLMLLLSALLSFACGYLSNSIFKETCYVILSVLGIVMIMTACELGKYLADDIKNNVYCVAYEALYKTDDKKTMITGALICINKNNTYIYDFSKKKTVVLKNENILWEERFLRK